MSQSGLRFLVDFNVGQAVTEYLRMAGYDVSFVGELDPRMDDVDILALAVREGRIVVTMDTDFGKLVYHAGRPHAGILLLRMPGAQRKQKVEAVAQILSQQATKLAGHFCVYQAGRLRVRP